VTQKANARTPWMRVDDLRNMEREHFKSSISSICFSNLQMPGYRAPSVTRERVYIVLSPTSKNQHGAARERHDQVQSVYVLFISSSKMNVISISVDLTYVGCPSHTASRRLRCSVRNGPLRRRSELQLGKRVLEHIEPGANSRRKHVSLVCMR
jgi:hypothetical protein